jgi:hypothetical protein
LDNQISNNQLYINQYQGQRPLQQPTQNYAYGAGNTKENAKEVVNNKTNAGYVASKFDVMQHPMLLVQNAVLGLATAIGITRLGEYLVKGKVKGDMSHAEALEQAPLFKLGRKVDNFIAKTPFLKNAVQKASDFKAKVTKTPKNPVFQEVAHQYKDGSKVTWSMGKFYEEGKGAEALDEFVEFLEKAPEDAFTKQETKDYIHGILKDVKAEKITRAQAGKKIVENGCLDGIKAEALEKVKLSKGEGFGSLVDRLFGTTPNLNSSLAKAKFFNGKTKALGPVSRTFNKLSLMLMEGTGGGLLGGKGAMFMSVFGLISAFNACSKAMVAKKEKQKQLAQGNLTPEQIKEAKKKPWSGEMVSSFMEDFSGFTVGGYLMTYPIGVAINKALGFANIGRDPKAVKALAQQLGVKGEDKLYQRTVIKYNETLKQDKLARDYIDYLQGNKDLSAFKKAQKLIGLTNDNAIKADMIEKLKLKIPADSPKEAVIAALRTKLKPDKWFNETRKALKTAGKSQLTLKSLAKENAVNKGTKGQRILRYVTQKPLELAAKILGPDKYLLFKKGSANRLRRFTDVGGGVGRIILVGMVLTVPFRNAFMKMSHVVFGKPSFSQYDEVKGVYDDKEEDKKEQDKKAAPTAPAQAQQSQATSQFKIKLPPAEPTGPILQPQNSFSGNPYNREIQEDVRSQDTYTYVPKNEIIEKGKAVSADKQEKEEHPVRKLDTYTYVPSSN